MRLSKMGASAIGVLMWATATLGIEVRGEVTVVDEIQPGTTTPFKTWYYPYGYVTVRTIDARGRTISTRRIQDGPQFKSIGANAGYQIKMYTKRDPRSEQLEKPVLLTEGFDPAYNMPGRNTFENMERITNTIYDLDGEITDEDGLLETLYNENYGLYPRSPKTFLISRSVKKWECEMTAPRQLDDSPS